MDILNSLNSKEERNLPRQLDDDDDDDDEQEYFNSRLEFKEIEFKERKKIKKVGPFCFNSNLSYKNKNLMINQ